MNKIIFFLFILLVPASLQAAFPINTQTNTIGRETRIATTTIPETGKATGKQRTKKQWLAITLLVLAGYAGAHRFYLGYPLHGVGQALLTILSILLFLAGFTLTGELTAPLVISGMLLITLGVWLLFDFASICIKQLKPHNGDYK